MKKSASFLARKSFLASLLIALLLSSLLAGCGTKEKEPDTSNLEAITASQSNNATPESSPPPTVAQTTATAQSANAPTNTPIVAQSGTTPPVSAQTTPTNPPTKAGSPATGVQVVPTPTVAAQPAKLNIKPGVILEPMAWESQTWNNCAPMSALMSLSYYGVKLTQEECGKALRPNSSKNDPGDKHVTPEELEGFIKKQGYKTMIRENGTLDKIRALLSAGVPVIIQQWLKENDDIGHYRVARGYDLSKDTFIFNDSMDTKPKTITASALQDKLWKGYDRRYLPVYTAKQEATVKAILGEDFETAANQQRALTAARNYAESNPKDVDAWRNLGYLSYNNGDCKGALNVWEQKLRPMLPATENGPYNRFLWYQLWPMECYNKVGNYQEVLKMAPNEIEKAKVYAEARYEYAVALSNTGKKAEAIAQLKKALLDDLNYQPTRDLLAKLGG